VRRGPTDFRTAIDTPIHGYSHPTPSPSAPGPPAKVRPAGAPGYRQVLLLAAASRSIPRERRSCFLVMRWWFFLHNNALTRMMGSSDPTGPGWRCSCPTWARSGGMASSQMEPAKRSASRGAT
jgi:hypothetical protein